ncbi:flagellar biosynthesis protein FlhB [Fontivita pretiosa]|uniref:flagellar biosynthesis protein FlhB n=1 Tax=Fontivita pretiosa TaxID=2989684 RepID=UPI003D16A940
MADETADKTEAPTPRRRAEAREQGNIARSPDLTAAVLLLACVMLLDWYGPGLIGAMKTLMSEALGPDSLGDFAADSAFGAVMLAMRLVAGAMAPLLLGVLLVAILINLAQVGFFFSFKRIQPKLTALNPFKGLNKLFASRDNAVQLAMNLLKLLLIAAVAYSAIHGRMDAILAVQNLEFVQIFSLGASIVYSIGLRIGMVLLALAILDYGWQKWRIEQQLKMSKQEIKEEMRRMEGDPQIKARRRQIAMQRLRQGIRQHVPTADVIVTNPTHYAVALKYDAETMNAPKVVAKGADYLAMMIRQIAIEHGVPILERPPLARSLYRLVEVGQEIPEQFYAAVAEILAYVYEVSGKVAQEQVR